MTYFSKYRSQIHHIKYYPCYNLFINYYYPFLSEDSDNNKQYNYHYTKSSSEKQPVYTQTNKANELYKNDNIIVQKIDENIHHTNDVLNKINIENVSKYNINAIEDFNVNKLSITWDDEYNEEDIIQLDFM